MDSKAEPSQLKAANRSESVPVSVPPAISLWLPSLLSALPRPAGNTNSHVTNTKADTHHPCSQSSLAHSQQTTPLVVLWFLGSVLESARERRGGKKEMREKGRMGMDKEERRM